MARRGKLSAIILTLCILCASARASLLEAPEAKSFALEAEGQLVWQSRNEAAIPGDTGTRFSLKDVIDSPVFGYRIEPTLFLGERHQLRGVFAPLTLKDTGTL